MYRLLTTIILLITFSIVQGCASIGISPTEFEWSYYAISVDIGNADLCYKISPEASTTTGSLAPGGAHIDYTRSECFYNVALKTKNSQLCKNVRRVMSFGFIDGSRYSERSCSKAIKGNKESNGPTPEAELIMRYLGYNDNDIENYKDDRIINNRLMVYEAFFKLYLDESETEVFKNKLMMLPDFSTSNAVAIDQIHSKYPQCTPENFDDPLCLQINCVLYWQGRENPRCYY